MTATPAAHGQDRTEALWARYRSAGDPEARAQLLVRHLGLVHHVAREVSRRIPSVELGELVSAGALGLMKALESFTAALADPLHARSVSSQMQFSDIGRLLENSGSDQVAVMSRWSRNSSGGSTSNSRAWQG